jgi:thioesterase domain-containing protein
MGGLVAFEMALQFAKQGVGVDGLVLFDTILGNDLPALPYDDIPGSADVRSLLRFLHAAYGFGDAESVHIARHAEPAEAIREILARARRAGIRAEFLDGSTLGNRIRVFEAAEAAAAAYRPRTPVDCDVVYVQARGTADCDAGRRALDGWSKLSRRPLFVLPADGDHFRMLEPPAVGSLAAALTSVLAENRGRADVQSV